MLGLKGYYTNISEDTLNNKSVIEKYKNLWQVEHSFRMSKSDLVARPIFHRKEESIKAHLLICFMALAMSKYIEMTTKFSIQKVIDILSLIGDARLQNIKTKKEVLLRSPLSKDAKQILDRIGMSY